MESPWASICCKMMRFSASEPSQKTTLSGLVSRAASSTQASIGVATISPRNVLWAPPKKGMDAPDPAGPDSVDLYRRLAGYRLQNPLETSPVYVTGNPGGKFTCHQGRHASRPCSWGPAGLQCCTSKDGGWPCYARG